MPKLIISATMMFIVCAAVLAQDNEEARVKAAVEDRYRESIAVANRKDTAAMPLRLSVTVNDTRGAGYAQFYSRSHDAVIRVYDEAGSEVETHEHAGGRLASA